MTQRRLDDDFDSYAAVTILVALIVLTAFGAVVALVAAAF